MVNVTEEEICSAIHSLFTETNPRTRTFTTLNQVVSELQSKLGGYDLTHKIDFITEQINLLFAASSQHQQQHVHHHQQQQLQQPPPPQQQPQLISFERKDHFTLHQNPNSHSVPVTSAFRNNVVVSSAAVADASVAHVSANVLPKESAQPKPKRRGGPGGLNKLCGVSPELQVIVGQPAMPRTEIVKQLWAYIKKNNLQDPSNKRKIICNDELRVVFETDCTDMFKMNKLLAKHIIALEPTKKPAPKKQKVEVEVGTRSAEPAPTLSVIISDSLANFFGVTGREMLQTEVLRRIWEYIKVNQLEIGVQASMAMNT